MQKQAKTGKTYKKMLATDKIIALTAGFKLQTQRLLLRRFKVSDMADEMAQQQDPQVVRYIRAPLSDAEAIRYFEDFIKPYHGEESEQLAICVTLKDDNLAIGAISFTLLSVDGIVEIGYRLKAQYHGKGYAFEAVNALVGFIFNELKAHKVVAYCDPRNLPSSRLMKKLGMQQEGLLRQHYKLGEQWNDELVYGLLASDVKETLV